VEKGILEAMDQGGVHGFPVVDLKVELFDGKYHSVDSSEMSFKMAGATGFREAMAKAAPVLLEPVSHIEVTVPESLLGDVMGDLNSRRGRVLGSESLGSGNTVVIAEVPASEILRYAIDLRSLSGGRGSFTTRHDHYDVVPSNLVDKLVAAAKS
jgi:elongation factor G